MNLKISHKLSNKLPDIVVKGFKKSKIDFWYLFKPINYV